MEFTASDLKWTKNVKRDNGNSWAYMEYNLGEVFYLNWSKGRADRGRQMQDHQMLMILYCYSRLLIENQVIKKEPI